MARPLLIPFLVLATTVVACSGDSFVVAPPAGAGGSGAGGSGVGGSGTGGSGTGGTGAGGESAAALACETFTAFKNNGGGDCQNCINDVCTGGQVINVCGMHPNDACIAQCGSDATCFCTCMTTRPVPCGTVVSNLYECLASKCGKQCN